MGHAIKKRKVANDTFITPRALGRMHIDAVASYVSDGLVWYDPFRHSSEGTYYSQFPSKSREWAEIEEGRDFFSFSPGAVDVICSNPPYSVLDRVFDRSCDLQPDVISYIIGVNNLTTRRLERMNKRGYGLVYVKMIKVYKWFGMSFICVWQRGGRDVIEYDRKVWREI